ncbi:MAG: MEMO1 family protein [Methanosphaera sp.]|nr:MEMO1 family protein [Methanosphaera sp.]
MIRKTCVAGLFYESDERLLNGNIDSIFNGLSDVDVDDENSIKSIVVPHAGYIYSGRTAGYAFNELSKGNLPDTFIIIGPNHSGIGDRLSLSTSKKWNTPLGDIDVDVEFINKLNEVDFNCTFDESAHTREHSIEVELPFLQYIARKNNHDFRIVPVIIKYQHPKLCKQLAKSIHEVSKELDRNIIVIASTDLTHYEDSDTAKYFDDKVMNAIGNMDSDDLFKQVAEYDITMCGYGPTITAIEYSKLAGAKNSYILNYSNSGDVSGDYQSVVGYTSAMIK